MINIEKIVQQEGDYHEFTFEFDGLEMDCLIRRNSVGALCGYVLINSDNTLYGLEYDEISYRIDFIPHGGLTFASEIDGSWQVGFDCAHSGDLCPALPVNYGGGVYRDLEYVKSECMELAKSLSKHFTKGVRIEVDTIRNMVISVDWKNQQEHIDMLQASTKLVFEFLNLGFSPVIVVEIGRAQV